MLINGKSIDEIIKDQQDGASQEKAEILEIEAIADGEIFEHEGPVLVKGDIGEGAKVTVKKGGLKVLGGVHDDVEIKVEGSSNTTNVNVGNNSVTVSGSSVVISNGSFNNISVNGDFSSSAGDDTLTGIIIEKYVGNDVKLDSSASITVNGAVGENLNAKASQDFNAERVDERAVINAGRDIEIDGFVANRSNLNAGRDAEIKLAENIILSTGRDVEITTAEGICQVSAGRDLEIAEAMGNGIYSAGRDAEIEKASADVTVNAGRRKDVCTTIASDAAPNSTPKNFDIF